MNEREKKMKMNEKEEKKKKKEKKYERNLDEIFDAVASSNGCVDIAVVSSGNGGSMGGLEMLDDSFSLGGGLACEIRRKGQNYRKRSFSPSVFLFFFSLIFFMFFSSFSPFRFHFLYFYRSARIA